MNSSGDLDHALALSLQEKFTQEQRQGFGRQSKLQRETVGELEKRYDPKLIVDERWELLDPHPNIHDLFVQFDAMFFDKRLVNSGVEVRWSPKMTLCAGVCSYEGRGGLCSVRLSVPLLKLRPRKDLVETLLHEMIHALLFVTERNTDHDGHGPNFCFHMKRINSLTATNITIYHTFHREVNQYRQHWWKCDGPCTKRQPYFGLVKRAINRAPSPRDPWWAEHQRSCGGSYTKVREPEGYGDKKSKPGKKAGVVARGGGGGKGKGRPSGCGDITEMLGNKRDGVEKKKGSSGVQSVDKNPVSLGSSNNIIPSYVELFNGKGRTLLASGATKTSKQPTSLNERRKKLLEAAESRMRSNQMKGVKRKVGSSGTGWHDIRSFTSTPQKAKRPKIVDSSTSSDCVVLDDSCVIPSTSRGDKHRHQSTGAVAPGPSQDPTRLPKNSTMKGASPMIDLVGESNSAVDSDCVVEIGDDDGHGESDEEVGVPLRMCPVCGRTDIPMAIINIHVTYCLDEEEAASELPG